MYHLNYTAYIRKELDFLNLLIARFHEQEEVNGLELDIALLKTQDIYEQLLRMKMNSGALIEKADGKKAAEPECRQSGHPKTQPAFVESNKENVIAETAIFAPVTSEVATNTDNKISKVKENPQPAQPLTEPVKATILAEKISPAGIHPINETLAQQKMGSDLSSRLQTAPLSSIAAGIGLNDKFLFIRELFKGDNTRYDRTIQNLDAAESLAAAMDSIRKQFDWDEKDGTVQKFINLVYRRHGSN